jgi:tight adherence protein B
VPVVKTERQARASALLERDRVIAAVGAALLVLVLTRWPVAAIGAAVAGWSIAAMPRQAHRERHEARTEAIALWTEMLRDSMGTARGIEGVLVATAAAAPVAIRPEIQRMAQRLASEPLGDVLDDLATDLDHPLGDLVVTALRLTSTTGGRRVREVLADLAAAAYAEAESHRRIAVARQRPRAALKYTALIIGGFVGLLAVFSRRYLEPYDSAVGQIVLAAVGFYCAAGLWWMHRMGRSNPVPRFLTNASGGAA